MVDGQRGRFQAIWRAAEPVFSGAAAKFRALILVLGSGRRGNQFDLTRPSWNVALTHPLPIVRFNPKEGSDRYGSNLRGPTATREIRAAEDLFLPKGRAQSDGDDPS